MYELAVRPYVYYDKRYPSHWISMDVAKRITSTLKTMGFEVINADRAKKLMEKATTTSLKEEIVIVFSQDVVPDKLIDNPSSPSANSLIRRFLNRGHSVVWMGDIPLLHIGFSNGEKRSLTNAVAQRVLGLNPNVPNVSIPVRHTNLGHILLLPTWIGTRPHSGLIPGTNGTIIPLSLSPHGAHAFIVTYYRGPTGFSFSGFIRLYDMVLDKPKKLSEGMIKGIVNVVFRNPIVQIWKSLEELQRKVRDIEESLNTTFNTLKSELDNLGKILEQILKLVKEKSETRK